MDKWFDAGSKIGNGLVDPTTGANLGTGWKVVVAKLFGNLKETQLIF